MPLEVLHRALVRLGLIAGGERAEVATLPGLWILLAGVQAVLAGREFSDHGDTSAVHFDFDLDFDFCRATFAPCLPSAVRVFLGRLAIVRFLRAAVAAFLMFFRAACCCFWLAMPPRYDSPDETVNARSLHGHESQV